MDWFGGGVSIKFSFQRHYFHSLFRVCCDRDYSIFERFLFNGDVTTLEAKSEICKSMRLDPTRYKLYDIYENRIYSRLDVPQLSLLKAQIVHDEVHTCACAKKDNKTYKSIDK